MNSTFKFKLLQALNKKNGNKGFTLIELLVVVIIIGVLAAIALPNLLGQVAKGRQAEARNNLGTVNRAQQAYRLENATFGGIGTTGNNGTLPVTLTGQYYDYKQLDAGTPTEASHRSTAKADFGNDIRDYESAVGQTASGAYSAVICEQSGLPNASFADKAGITIASGAATCNATNAKEVK
jgi:prepilin-type N-terminal cleavage/methylation domain-containing protein